MNLVHLLKQLQKLLLSTSVRVHTRSCVAIYKTFIWLKMPQAPKQGVKQISIVH